MTGPRPGFAETTPLNFLFVLAVGLVAGTISGIVGTGSSIMLMPVLVYQYGPKQAVPIMAIAAGVANLSRILAGSTGGPAPPTRSPVFQLRHSAHARCWRCRLASWMSRSVCF